MSTIVTVTGVFDESSAGLIAKDKAILPNVAASNAATAPEVQGNLTPSQRRSRTKSPIRP